MRTLRSAFLCLLLLARPALAQDRRVALIDADVELEHAVSVALSPWGVTIATTHQPSPGNDLLTATSRAAALCRQLTVNVVVWVSESDRGSLLWIYDAETNQVTTRELAEQPPFSSPAAASVALSLKALLRTTDIAPQLERAVPPPLLRRTVSERLTLGASGSVRFIARDTTEVRGSVGGMWWVRPGPTRIGAALFFGAGPGVSIRTPHFAGKFRDLSVSAVLAWQVIGSRFVRSSLFGGATAHFSKLSGVSQSLAQSAESQRVTPTLDAGSDIALTLGGGFHLDLGVKALYLPRRPRYLVKGETVLSLWPVAAEFGVRLGVDLW